MASGAYGIGSKVTAVVINKDGLYELLKSEEIIEFNMGIAEEIARDASTTGDREYTTLLRTNRKSRNVATVLDTADDAMVSEAKTGNLARAARKLRR